MNFKFKKNMENDNRGFLTQKINSLKVKGWGIATVTVNGEKLTVGYPEYEEDARK